MSRLLAVAARELRERWLFLPGAFAAGFLVLVMPAFGISRSLVPTMGLVAAALLAAAAAVVTGSSMLARDTAVGRLGFLFSRPLPWAAIWGGKWLAALLLAALCALLACIPWMAAYPRASLGGDHDTGLLGLVDGRGVAQVLVVLVLAIGFANLAATLFRSRSPWLALDLVLMLGATWAAWRYLAPLLFYGILAAGQWTLALALLPVAVGLVAGSLAQVATGRTDLRRAHLALSLGFWAVIGLTLAAAALRWLEVRSTGPDEVSAVAVSRDPSGRFVYVEGFAERSARYPHRFLIDTTTGRYLSRPAPDEEPVRFGGLGVLFSADGRFAALPGAASGGAGLTLVDLREPGLRATRVLLESSRPPTWMTGFALSPAAATVFVAHESAASLFELPSGRRLATTAIPPGWQPAAVRYVAEGSARAWLFARDDGPARTRPSELRVLTLAADGTSSTATFPIGPTVTHVSGWRVLQPDAAGERIVTAEGGLVLRDGATGAPLARLVEGGGNPPALFLADGRIVVEGRAPDGGPPFEQPHLWVFDRAGTKLADVPLPPSTPGRISIGPEAAPGRILVWSDRGFRPSGRAVLADIASGEIVETLAAGLAPARGFQLGAPPAAPEGPSRVQFFTADTHAFSPARIRGPSQLVRIDFATGERKVVVGPGAPSGERISAR